MKKRYRKMVRKANGKIREVRDGSVLLEFPLSMAEVLGGMTDAVRALSEEAGLLLMEAAMHSECERIAGPKHSRNPLRRANWWGGELSPVYYGDRQKVLIERPRLRDRGGKEIPLSTYRAFKDPGGIKGTIMKRMVLGISSRNYEETVEGLLKGYGIKKSSVSRHFVKATAEQMREFLERDLTGLELCAIFIDAIEYKGQTLVVALGLDRGGRKQILGLRQGATENAGVCKMLLEDMARRGLDTEREYLFVLDGSKALRAAVARMFGREVLVQRCQMHKRRNVKEHLSEEHHNAIDARIRKAYTMTDYAEAKKSLELTVRYLERLNPSAAASLREGLEETLTLHKLGITGLLRKTLSTTNPIESCFSVTKTITGRVKRWRGGDMLQRWAVAALLRAEKKFNRVRGYREIPNLLIALERKSLARKEDAA